MRRLPEGLLPFATAALALLGSLGAILVLSRAASQALSEAQEARLRAAGETASLLFSDLEPHPERLAALMGSNALDGAYLVGARMEVLADANGPSRPRVDLLRTDVAQVERALTGVPSIQGSYTLGELEVATGYFPVRDASGAVKAVLALEVGRAFEAPRQALRRALGLGVAVSLLGAVALAVAAARWSRSERERRLAATRAGHAAAITQMAAMAAHEFRNPLHIVRGTVELLKERSGETLAGRDREDLDAVLDEVSRMRRLTDDFLELTADRSLNLGDVALEEVLDESKRGVEATYPRIHVRRPEAKLPTVRADAHRLRQVFSNLLTNAAQAQGEGELVLSAFVDGRDVCVEVKDSGPGVPEAIRARLFDPFVSGKADGTGLGLALSRRLLERHGGTLSLKEAGPTGTTFQARLPVGGPRETPV